MYISTVLLLALLQPQQTIAIDQIAAAVNDQIITLSDIDKALECGTWGVSISIPIGYLQIKHKLKWPEPLKLLSEINQPG
jgi:parvulin-like peptidyl-prolyl isomerase